MLTAFQLVLMRYAQQQRLVIGMPVSGRIRPELQSSIGYYASTAVIYTDFNGVEVGREALQRVKASVKETQGRQQLPFENLVNMLDLPRSLSHSPLFQILYIYHNHVTPRAFTLAGAYWEQVTYHNQTVKYDMTVEVFQNDATFDVSFEYDLGLYDADVVKQIAEALRQHCLSLTSSLETPIGAILCMHRRPQRRGVIRSTPLTSRGSGRRMCCVSLNSAVCSTQSNWQYSSMTAH